MSHYDGGPYAEGGEPPLTFATRRPSRGGGPAPVTLVLSLLILLAIGAGVFFLYRGGVRGANGAPEPVGVPIGDVRTAAPASAQAPDPAAGLTIYKDTSADATAGAPPAPAFAAPPETPTPRPQAGVGAAPPPPSAPKLAAPVPEAPTPPKAVAVEPALPPATPSAAPAAPQAVAKAGDVGGGSAVVQIGAFSSASQADKGWDAAAGIAPGAMVGKGKKVDVVTRGDETFYRTSITGFTSREEARALCDKLQSAGKTCFVR